MKIRRNKDGQQNLHDLRKSLAETKVSVYIEGGVWMISDALGYVTPCPYWYNERQAIQKAIFGEIESKAEAEYNRR